MKQRDFSVYQIATIITDDMELHDHMVLYIYPSASVMTQGHM